MDYLETAVFLKQLIDKANQQTLELNKGEIKEKNKMLIRSTFGKEINVTMDTFSNEFVTKTLGQYDSEAFVMTYFATIMQDSKELSYFLYKGYNSVFDKGLVYFQLVDKNTLEPIGDIEFSNLEDNIFYKITAPNVEESSCNAIETKENTTKKPCIAFLIGHENEERLLFDIQRLIYDTANNVQKHKNRHFKFIIQIDTFGKDPSPNLIAEIERIKRSVEKYIAPAYNNSEFVFAIGEE